MKSTKTAIELPNGVRISFTNDSNKHVVDMFMSTIGKLQSKYDKEQSIEKATRKKQDYKDQMKVYQERCKKKLIKSKSL